jgi:hypothetical protein
MFWISGACDSELDLLSCVHIIQAEESKHTARIHSRYDFRTRKRASFQLTAGDGSVAGGSYNEDYGYIQERVLCAR